MVAVVIFLVERAIPISRAAKPRGTRAQAREVKITTAMLSYANPEHGWHIDRSQLHPLLTRYPKGANKSTDSCISIKYFHYNSVMTYTRHHYANRPMRMLRRHSAGVQDLCMKALQSLFFTSRVCALVPRSSQHRRSRNQKHAVHYPKKNNNDCSQSRDSTACLYGFSRANIMTFKLTNQVNHQR